MKKYLDKSGSSGITFYQLGEDYIDVRFKTQPASTYRYTYSLSGKKHIEAMKKLATAGRGLGTYISQHPEVRDHYIKF